MNHVELTSRKGGEIHGRVLLLRALMFAFLGLIDRGVGIGSCIQADGSFVMRGAPPDRWRIRAHRWRRSGEIEDETTGAVGETVELDVRAR